MKVKQRSTCETCRKRKVGCDGKRPGCSQCVLTGRKCDGYQSDWTFVAQTPHSANAAKQKQRNNERDKVAIARHRSHPYSLPPSRPALPSVGFTPLSRPSLAPRNDDLLTLIVRSYIPESELPYISNNSDIKLSRICGSWVEVLPQLSDKAAPSRILSAATKALAGAIQSQSPDQNGSTVACTQSYNAAIHALRKGFSIADYPFHAEFTAAIMCLTLVEVMFPDSAVGVAAHVKGVEQLFQAHGPEKYSSGILHKLFVGFRPLLVIQAFQQRRSTLLANEPWNDVPFSVFSPSPMQSLLSEVITLPSLLQYIDALLASPDPHKASKIPFLIKSFTNTITRLDEWELSLRNNAKTLSYWHLTCIQSTPEKSETFIWYPDVTFANVYTHLWTFHIVCLAEIMKLVHLFPRIPVEGVSQRGGFRPRDTLQQMTVLAEQILSSMEYLFQDEMKLFGPASTFLPLQTANRVFRMDELNQKKNILRLEGIVDRLIKRGLRSAPIVVLGENHS